KLRTNNLRPSAATIKGFDTDRDFLLVEVTGDEMHFQAITRAGQTIDADTLKKQRTKSEPAAGAGKELPKAGSDPLAFSRTPQIRSRPAPAGPRQGASFR